MSLRLASQEWRGGTATIVAGPKRTVGNRPIAVIAARDHLDRKPSFVQPHLMNDGRYKGGGTTGGKWGCALAAVFGLPVFCLSVLVASMGDCMPGVQCHRGFWLEVLLPTILVAAPIGFGARWLVNRWRRDGR